MSHKNVKTANKAPIEDDVEEWNTQQCRALNDSLGIRTSRQMEVSSGSGKVQEIVASYEVQTPDLRAPELGAE